MNIQEFRHSMICGLGRCYVELKRAEDPEIYRDVVEWGCTNSISYNVQSDGCRSEYVYELTKCFKDPTSFVPAIVDAYAHLDVSDSESSKHLAELLGLFARDGTLLAAKALEQRYSSILAKLRRRASFNGVYDYTRDALIDCVEGMMLYVDERRFAKVAKRLGKLILESSYYGPDDFENLYYDVAYRYVSSVGPRVWLRYLHDESPEAQTFLKAYRRTIRNDQAMQRRIKSKIAERKNRPNPDKMAKLNDLLNAKDSREIESALTYFIDNPYVGDVSQLIKWAKSEDVTLADTALSVLAHTRDKAVWQYALTLLEKGEHIYDAMSMLVINESPDTREWILKTLYDIPVILQGEENWHGAVQTILDSPDFGVQLPYEYYWFIYNRSLCAHCRSRAVEYLNKKGQINDEIKAELIHDANEDVRAIGNLS